MASAALDVLTMLTMTSTHEGCWSWHNELVKQVNYWSVGAKDAICDGNTPHMP